MVYLLDGDIVSRLFLVCGVTLVSISSSSLTRPFHHCSNSFMSLQNSQNPLYRSAGFLIHLEFNLLAKIYEKLISKNVFPLFVFFESSLKNN